MASAEELCAQAVGKRETEEIGQEARDANTHHHHHQHQHQVQEPGLWIYFTIFTERETNGTISMSPLSVMTAMSISLGTMRTLRL